jgi:hypothetical protein
MKKGAQFKRVYSPSEFVEAFKPSEYGETWDEVVGSEEFHRPEEGRMSHAEMVESIRNSGVTEPVQVHNGYVVDGHHRAAAAIAAGAQITVEKAAGEMYEGQIK